MQNDIKNRPAITVLMSVHNSERFVQLAIKSILEQTRKDFEFVIVDDASTDQTAAIIDSFTDPRITMIRNDNNLGLTKSLNKGLKNARGVYVARMDADDIAFPNRLEIQHAFLESHPDIVAVGGENEIINDTGLKTGFKKVTTDPELIRFNMVIANQLNHSTVMFRKKEILEQGGYNEKFKYVQDFELWSRLSACGFRFSNIPQPLLKYRFHPSSITQAKNSKDDAYDYVVEIIKKNLSKYASFSDTDLPLFLESFHHHHVGSCAGALRVLRMWKDLGNGYIAKENPGDRLRTVIQTYVQRERIKTLRWYIKDQFSVPYKLGAIIVKHIRSRQAHQSLQ